MKTAVIVAAAALGLANAKPHGHQHLHHKRDAAAVSLSNPVATAYAYVLNGETISQDDVCSGIASGDLRWEGSEPAGACSSPSSISVATPTVASTTSSSATSAPPSSSSVAPSSTIAAAEFFEASSSSSSQAPSTSASSSSAYASATASASSSDDSSNPSVGSLIENLLNNIVMDIEEFVVDLAQPNYDEFPDGEIDCSTFPSKYGAIPVSYLNMNGWTGIQHLNSAGNDIVSDGDDCVEGAACSYACAPSLQKVQWPSSQPSDGASIGGLLCKGGKLYKSGNNQYLCGQGNGKVYVQNKSGSSASVCRTDYPGNEAENVPLDISSGGTQPLTCPIEEDYYEHMGSPTSAQYYLNPLGVKANPGCSWDGDGNGDSGNSAPIVFGVGETGGTTWLSIQQNTPTYYGAFSGTVEIVGDDISQSCKYSNGQYCDDSGCTSHTVNGAGCTVATTGKATFVISS